MRRKLAVILASDVAGYSRMMAADEESTVERFAEIKKIFSDLVDTFHGRIFNTAGDAILAEFQSATEAVRCAMEIQDSVRAKNFGQKPGRQILFRIGISIGDVIIQGEDLLGDGVNVAARLQTLAQPGSVCVSEAVYEHVARSISCVASDLGSVQLKNIPKPIRVLEIRNTGSRGPAAPAPAETTVFMKAPAAPKREESARTVIQTSRPPGPMAQAAAAAKAAEKQAPAEAASTAPEPAADVLADEPDAPAAARKSKLAPVLAGAAALAAGAAALWFFVLNPSSSQQSRGGPPKLVLTETVPAQPSAVQTSAPAQPPAAGGGATAAGAEQAARQCAQLTAAAPDRMEWEKARDICQAAAAAQPSSGAIAHRLALALQAGKQDGEAIKQFEKAALLGSAAAMNDLGWTFESGSGAARDFAQARGWYEKAAASGDAAGMANLAWLYEQGRGVAQSDAEAKSWYEKAAAAGSARAMFSVGIILARGRGVPKNEAEARVWFARAAEKSHVLATRELGRMHQMGLGGPVSFEQARTWFTAAGDFGDAQALFELGKMNRDGVGGPKNLDEAKRHFRRAAGLGHAPSAEALKALGG